MKIAVTGATGQLGSLVLEQLKQKVSSSDIIALARTPEKAEDLDIEVRAFDYSQTETLAPALEGVDHLLLISSSEVGQRAAQHENVIQAAKKAGVKWIIYTSLLHADQSSLSLAGEHLATEKMLAESGIPFTILRNGWYTENYTASIPGALAGGAFLGSAGEGKISSAAREDFAAAAVAVLTGEGHVGKTYELAGDEAYTLKDFAAEISKQSGKNIPYNNLPEAEFAKILESFGLPKGFAAALASWDTGAGQGDLFDDSRQLSKLIGRPTTPISATISKSLG